MPFSSRAEIESLRMCAFLTLSISDLQQEGSNHLFMILCMVTVTIVFMQLHMLDTLGDHHN